MHRIAVLAVFVGLASGCADPAEAPPDAAIPSDAAAPRDVGFPDATPLDAGVDDAGVTDAAPRDAETPDVGAEDAGSVDADVSDAGAVDASSSDAEPADAEPTDAQPADAAPADAQPADAAAADAQPADAAPADAAVTDAAGADAAAADAAPADAQPADAQPADAAPADATPADSGPPDSGPLDSGVSDAGSVDAGPVICSASPNSCANGEVCLGESCSCVQQIAGDHYLRTDGTVVSWLSTPRIITEPSGGQLNGVTQVFAGSAHGCALKSDGTVWCWPFSSIGNNNGQLGNGAIVSSTPLSAYYIATQVLTSTAPTPLTGVVAINGGASRGYAASNSCAVTTTGNLYCWGSPDSSGGGGGTLFNDGVGGNRTLAVAILASANTPLTGVRSVSLGLRHACVTRDGATNREVWCWGANIGGALGQGNQTARQYPVQVTLPGPADQMGAGSDATCARVGGSVYCWGSNNTGQVGIGPHTLPANHDGCINWCKMTPAQVVDGNGMPLANVVDYQMAYLNSCALLADNSLWCWGRRTASSQSDWAIPAVVGSTTLTNVARFTTAGTSGYGTGLRYINRDNTLYRATQLVTPVCP